MKETRQYLSGGLFDIEGVARVLEASANPEPGRSLVEFVVENELLGLTLRLCLDEERRLAGVYVRKGTAFLGFLAIRDVTDVNLHPGKGEVKFIGSSQDRSARLCVGGGGYFLFLEGLRLRANKTSPS